MDNKASWQVVYSGVPARWRISQIPGMKTRCGRLKEKIAFHSLHPDPILTMMYNTGTHPVDSLALKQWDRRLFTMLEIPYVKLHFTEMPLQLSRKDCKSCTAMGIG